MKHFFLSAGIALFLSVNLFAQKIDAISGETIKIDNLDLFISNDSIRALYNNDAFDNIQASELSGIIPQVKGEILNPGIPSTEKLLVRTVTVKEYLPSGSKDEPVFMGAFQYYGYSLADLLKDYVISKKNHDEFKQSTDLYIVVENNKGEKAVFSWGELYYTASANDIILATGVQPIFPKSEDDRWEVPTKIKLIAANDYLTVRNIDNPVSISIRSFPRSFPGYKGLQPLYSPEISVSGQGMDFVIRDQKSINHNLTSHNTVFFGLSRGYKGGRKFTGTPLADVLREAHKFSIDDLKKGLVAFGAKDAYRVVYSISELLNRTDMAETLLIDAGNDADGRFIIRPGSDFFADRHLKGAETGYFLIEGDDESVR